MTQETGLKRPPDEISTNVVDFYLTPPELGGIGLTPEDLETPIGKKIVQASIENAQKCLKETGEPIDFNDPLPGKPALISHN